GESQAESERHSDYKDSLIKLNSRLSNVDVSFPPQFVEIPRWDQEADNAKELERKARIQSLEELLNDKEVDYIIAMGPASAKIASDYGRDIKKLSKPVFAPIVLDAKLQDIGTNGKENNSQIQNFHYFDTPYAMDNDLEAFGTIKDFLSLTIIMDQNTKNSVVGSIEKAVRRRFPGVQRIEVVSVNDSSTNLISELAALPESSDVVYLTNTFAMTSEQRNILIQGLNDLQKPSFSQMGERDVKEGVLASLLMTDIEQKRKTRLVSMIEKHYANKIPLSQLPVNVNVYGNLTVNVKTANSTGVNLSWDVLAEAKQVSGRTGYGRFKNTSSEGVQEISLIDVMKISKNHPMLRKVDTEISLLNNEVMKSRASYLPQIHSSLNGMLIDADRAALSLQTLPEYTVNAGLQLRQNIWSPLDSANIALAKEKTAVKEKQLAQLSDIIKADLTQVYVMLCHARAKEDALRIRLGQIRNVYDIARRRAKRDYDAYADELRMDAELRTAKQELLHSQSESRKMELLLNQVMGRPLDMIVKLADVDTSREVRKEEALLLNYIQDPQSFPIFAQVMIEEGKSRSHDLMGYKDQQALKRTELELVKGTQFSPRVGLNAGVQYHFLRKSALPIENTDLNALLSERDALDWGVGVRIDVPLFDGLYAKASISEKYDEITQLQHQFDEKQREFEVSTHQRLVELNTHFRSISFAKQARDNTGYSLEQVLELYEQDKATLSEVFDAVETAMDANLSYLNTVFAFRNSFVSTLGSIGLLDYYTNFELRNELFDKLEELYRNYGFSRP
ncbi:MAG: TolC family protein, partial [Myxococcota bacterium]|nr:TolC family protein [Myxococcota bacterium]